LPDYDRSKLAQWARELGFVRDTLEKVLRLSDVLMYINADPLLSKALALKGGTAINMTVFDLPRLSVDIDLDYMHNNSKEEMFSERKKISEDLMRYIHKSGYELSDKSKFSHSLDSYIFSYTNVAGTRDNIKLEINYSLRSHVLSPEQRIIKLPGIIDPFDVNSLALLEIFASKIAALLIRTAPRDLYDINNMICYSLFNETEISMLRKCTIFYYVLNGGDLSIPLDLHKINNITERRIRTDLLPVIRKGEKFDLNTAKQRIIAYLHQLSNLSNDEAEFLLAFKKGEYCPDLLFNDTAILERIRNHPMAIWKTR